MSDVVDFLERIGSEARWRTASTDELEQALAATSVEAPVRSAILAKDASELYSLLGTGKLMAMQTPSPAPYEVPQPPEPDEEGEGEEDPDGATSLREACAMPSSPSLSLS